MPQSLFNARKNEGDPVRGNLIEQFFIEENIFLTFPFSSTNGAITWPYKVEGSLPSIAFRKLNEAFPEGVPIIQRPVETLKPLGLDSDTDIVIAKANPLERAVNARMTAKAIAAKLVQSIFYANSPASRAGVAFNDVDGFDGLMARLGVSGTNVVDNGASSGLDGSSIFAIRFGEGWVEGLMQDPLPGISIRNFGEIQAKPVFRSRIDACAGIKVSHGRAVGWLKDITVGTPVSKDKLDEMIDKVAGRPDVLMMTKRSRTQLRKALQALGITLGRDINELGRPMELYGDIPIIISDAMIDTETCS